MNHPTSSQPMLETVRRSLVVLLSALATLLIARAWVAGQIGYGPLPFAEPLPYHAVTVLSVGLASALAGRLLPGWRGVAVSAVSAFAAYLGWAVVQQNLILNPDIWKLWERHWLTVAVACGLAALLLALALEGVVGLQGPTKTHTA